MESLAVGPSGSSNFYTLRAADSDWRELVQESFPHEGTAGFLQDFPIWSQGESAGVERWGLSVGGSLVATAGVRRAEWRVAGRSAALPVALIGAVGCRAEFRGKGHATALLTYVLKQIEHSGEHATILWGAFSPLYSRLGFEPFGAQIEVELARLPLPLGALHPGRGTVVRGWSQELGQALLRTKVGLVRKESDLVWLSNHPNVEWWRWEESGQLHAYCGVGRGIDLPDRIHEWGGDPWALQALLAQVRAQWLMGTQPLMKHAGLEVQNLIGSPQTLCLIRWSKGASLNAEETNSAWFWGLDGV